MSSFDVEKSNTLEFVMRIRLTRQTCSLEMNLDLHNVFIVKSTCTVHWYPDLVVQWDDDELFNYGKNDTLFLYSTPAVVSADTLYKNDGISFEDNWQERVIERYIVLLVHSSAHQTYQSVSSSKISLNSSMDMIHMLVYIFVMSKPAFLTFN